MRKVLTSWVRFPLTVHPFPVFLASLSPRTISRPPNRSFVPSGTGGSTSTLIYAPLISNAVWKLLAARYQLIISGTHLAEMDDCLLKRAQALQPFVPFVVTASASEKERARRVLERGALDLMLSPLDHGQTVRTIRLAFGMVS